MKGEEFNKTTTYDMYFTSYFFIYKYIKSLFYVTLKYVASLQIYYSL